MLGTVIIIIVLTTIVLIISILIACLFWVDPFCLVRSRNPEKSNFYTCTAVKKNLDWPSLPLALHSKIPNQVLASFCLTPTFRLSFKWSLLSGCLQGTWPAFICFSQLKMAWMEYSFPQWIQSENNPDLYDSGTVFLFFWIAFVQQK